MDSLRDAALGYAARGWAVHPLRPGKKEPATTHGVLDATTDASVIRGWWERWPEANIGIACGEPSGFFVVDVDPRNLDEDERMGLAEWEVSTQATLQARTGGGGLHALYVLPENIRLRGKAEPGVDIKSTGGYIVAPPSIHPDGPKYVWVNEHAIGYAPGWLLDKVVRPVEAQHTTTPPDPNDDRPGTVYNRLAQWSDILCPHGWKVHEERGEETMWTRPGKTEGVSATTNYDGSGLFYVFSTSVEEFEEGRGYDKLGTYAALNFDGDISAAVESLVGWTPPGSLFRPPTSSGSGVEPDRADESKQPVTEEEYSFTPAYAPEHYVSRYIEYAAKMTDAPLEYHEAGALMQLAVSTPFMRAQLAPFPGGLKSNLYLLMLGVTTRARKSTAQRIARDIIEIVNPAAALPSRMTPEALVGDLASRSGSASVWMPDEFGAMLAQINRRDYLKGLEELLLTLYGGDDYTYLRADRQTIIRNPHVSVFGAATPESVALSGPTAMLGGLLPRFGVVFPVVLPRSRPAATIEDLSSVRMELANSLRIVIQASQQHPMVVFSPEAVALLNVEEEEYTDSKAPGLARLPVMLYKVASLNAAARLSGTVNAEDAASAVGVVTRWRDGAKRLAPILRHKATDMEFERKLELAREILREEGGVAHRSAIARKVQVTKRDMDAIQATLVDRGYIVYVVETGQWRMAS